MLVDFRVFSRKEVIIQIKDDAFTPCHYMHAAPRGAIGNSGMDFVLTEREKTAEYIKRRVGAEASGWGVDVESIKIQKCELRGKMERAEAERKRRAVITAS